MPSDGQYANYLGGGYLFKYNGSRDQIFDNLTLLQELSWIDRRTRAIFIEFTTYNPNINVFSYCNLLVEFLPTGSVLRSHRFSTFNLFEYIQGYAPFKIACDVLLIIFVCIIVIKEFIFIYKKKLRYFVEFWNYVTWCNVAFAWVAFAMYLYRLNTGFSLSSKISKQEFINLQYIASVDDTLSWSLGFCCCFSSLKLIKFLNLNRRIEYMVLTLKYAFGNLLSFSVIFFIIFLAYTQFFYIIFNNHSDKFVTFLNSLVTCMTLLITGLNIDDMIKSAPILGPILFSTYNMIIGTIFFSIFYIILIDSFETVRHMNYIVNERHELFNHIIQKVKNTFKKKNKIKSDVTLDGTSNLDRLSKKIDQLNTRVRIQAGI